jgi:alpha-mannosidase
MIMQTEKEAKSRSMAMSLVTAILVLCTFIPARGQAVYFADGYHGGVYGHYPDWVTGFILSELEKNPYWSVNLEIEPETLDSIKQRNPDDYLEFVRLFPDLQDSRRIEIVNPAYAQSYMYNISGESLIRQFQYGMEKILFHLPGAKFTTYSVEEPCFTSALPAILTSLGFKYAVLKNPNTCWGGYTRAFGGELVNWIGPDGSQIPAVPRYLCEMLEPGSTWQTTAWRMTDEFLDTCFSSGIAHPIGMCFQDAGWNNGPWMGEGKNVKAELLYKTWTDYFENVAISKPIQNWLFSQEDVLVSLVWGSQVLQKIAQQVRDAENNIIMAEKMAAMAGIYGTYEWPGTQFDEAWRMLTLSQHHDCWIVPYNGRPGDTWADKVARWTNSTNRICNSIIDSSMNHLFRGSEISKPGFIRIYNTAGSNRKELVEVNLPWTTSEIRVKDLNGSEVPSVLTNSDKSGTIALAFQADVPSCGFSDYSIEYARPKETEGVSAVLLEDGTCKIESNVYRIQLDPSRGGSIKSLIAKRLNNREIVDQQNRFSFNELRGYFFDVDSFHSSVQHPAEITILENGPLRAKVRISGMFGMHPFSQIIAVENDQERIDFKLHINWQSNPSIGAFSEGAGFRNENRTKAFYNDTCKLLALFPVSQKSQNVYINAPFDVCESRLQNTFFTRWDSIKHNIILNWIDVFDPEQDFGVSLLSDHTTSYTHGEDFPLGLVIQYSGVGLWGRNYRIHGDTEIDYAIRVHKNMWNEAGCWNESVKWNESLIPQLIQPSGGFRAQRKSLVSINSPGYEVTAMLMEGNDLLVRLFNAEGENEKVKVSVDCEADRIELVELDGTIKEIPESVHNKDHKTDIWIHIPRFGFSTIRLSNVNMNKNES